MARINVTFLPTGQKGSIEENEFDSSIYAIDSGQQLQQQAETPKKGNWLIDALLGPVIKGARTVGEASNQYLGTNLPGLTEEEVSQIRKNPIKEAAKQVAGVGSYAIPFGKGGTLLKRALLPGAGMYSARNFSEDQPITPEGLVISAATAGVLDKVLGGSRVLQKGVEQGEGNIAQKWGRKIENAAIEAPVDLAKPNAPTLTKIFNQLRKDYGLTGKLLGKQNQIIDETYNAALGKVKSLADKTVNTVPKDKFVSSLTASLKNLGYNLDEAAPNIQSFVESLPKNLKLNDVLKFKERVNQAIGERGWNTTAALSARQEIAKDIYREVNNEIPKLNKGATAATKIMSDMHKLSEGVGPSSVKEIDIPLGWKVRLPSQLRSVLSVAGGGIEKAGDVVAGMGGKMGPLGTILGQRVAQQGALDTLGASGNQQMPQMEETQGYAPSTQSSQQNSIFGGSPEEIKQRFEMAMIQDLQTTGGKNIPELKIIYDMISGGEGKALTEQQVARKQTKGLLVDAIEQFSTGAVKTGPFGIQSGIEGLKAKFGAGDQPTLNFRATVANLKATIAKARAGTSFTPNEERLLNQYTPNNSDSAQEVATKMIMLRKALEGGDLLKGD